MTVKLKVGNKYRISNDSSTKEGYRNKPIKIIEIQGYVKSELLEDIYENGELTVKKGSFIHTFGNDLDSHGYTPY